MISKERLEELIEQGATIYTSGYRENCCFKNETIVDLAKLDYFNKTKTYSIKDFGGGDFVLLTGYTCDNGCDEYLTPDELFENEEEAEWHREFGHIERIERLELPTWEEISRDLKDVPAGTYVIKEFDDVSLEYIKYNEVFIGIYKGDYEWKEWEATKENYTLACRKAKELFLGEKK